jgi:Sec-independent protein translocase protein TatA
MEILNVGGWELLLILFLGLLLFGPRDLVKIARLLGNYVQQAQQTWQEFALDLDTEIARQAQEEEDTAAPEPRIIPPESIPPEVAVSPREPVQSHEEDAAPEEPTGE